MLKLEDQIADKLADDITKILAALHSRPTWDGEKHKLFASLKKLLTKHRYKRFWGDFRDYHLERKGQYCLYDVPADQRGFLKQFRNKRVRLICADRSDTRGGPGREFYVAKVPVKE